MTLKFYAVFDSVSNSMFTSFCSLNDGMAIRDNLPQLSRVRPVQDLVFYHVADVDDSTMEVVPVARRLVPQDSYKFPENVSNFSSSKH